MSPQDFAVMAAKIANTFDEVLADGKIKLGEVFTLLGQKDEIASLVQAFPEVKKEFKAMSRAQRKRAAEAFAEELALQNNERAEILFERSVNVAIVLADFAAEMRLAFPQKKKRKRS